MPWAPIFNIIRILVVILKLLLCLKFGLCCMNCSASFFFNLFFGADLRISMLYMICGFVFCFSC